MNGWTLERRKRQSEAIRRWKPWERSTGPRTEAGKAKTSRNGYKGGQRQRLRELRRIINAEIRAARELVDRVNV
ncbi:MAG: hypothetical protein EPN34_07055 [Burkholderiaceae bacterium]|nr:MAG: hypothetical protein EPN34_07055 [Burkholderiaceae bacterium]